jgi:uncharacterized protein YneF (UPF0154 family)
LDENSPIRILFLASDPSDASRLRLGQELRDIRERLQMSRHRDCFLLESRESVRPSDITQAIFDLNPRVIHFSGHGTQSGDICLEDVSGKIQAVLPSALTALFSLVSEQVECVILNACYSEVQAKAISKYIPFVVGMNKEIGDKAAIAFSVGFYKALVAGHLVEKAYKFGCVEIQLNGIQEHLTPILHELKNQEISRKCIKWSITLNATLDDIDKEVAEKIIEDLKHLSGDVTLTLQKIESGSVILILEGSEDGYEKIKTLLKSGKLQETANFTIKNIQLQSEFKIPEPIFYIDRPPIESSCYEAITQPSLIRIRAPWQMGKTSLMMKILDYGVQQGYHAVRLSFQAADAKVFDSTDRLLKWFCASTARSLNLDDKLEFYWNERPPSSSKYRCTKYFEEYLLPTVDTALVLGLDETDLIFQKDEVGLDFLGLIRSWHEQRMMDRKWQKLRFIIAHSLGFYTNINQSPFNLGLPIELPPFNASQVKELAQRYSVKCSKKQLEQIMEMINGHPYLLQESLKSISTGRIRLSDLLKFSNTDLGIFKDHLSHYSMVLESYPELKSAMKQVAESDVPVKLEASKVHKLESLGLVKIQGNEVMPACRLYRDYFREHLLIK